MFKFIKNELQFDDKENNFYFLITLMSIFFLPLYKISSSPFLILFSIIIVVNLFKNLTSFYSLLQKKINSLFLLLFFVVIISLSYSQNLESGLIEVEKLLPLLIYPFLFTIVKLKNSQIILLLKAFVLGCIIAFLLSLSSQFYHMFKGEEYSFYYIKFVEVLWMHPTYLSIYLNFAIIIVYYLFIKKEISLVQLIVSVFIFILFILLLAARMQIINMVVMFLFIFIHFLKNHFSIKYLLIYMLIPIVFGLIALNNQKLVDRFKYVQNLEYNLESTNYKDWNGANVRLAIWECAFEVINDNLLIGVGIGDENDELLDSYKNNDFTFAYDLNYVAHNQYIQFLISNGIIGLLSYLVIFIFSFYYAIRNRHFLLFGLTLLLLFSGFTESFLKMQSGIVFFSFMILLLFQYKTLQKH